MKREILFRAKKNNGDWVEGMLIKDRLRHYRIQFNPECFTVVVLEKTVGQFTGMLDIDKEKIFEGDIIKAPSGRLYVVIWSTWIHDEKRNKFLTDRYEFTGWCISKDGINPCDTLDCETLKGEVIGNIHDTPELLNQK